MNLPRRTVVTASLLAITLVFADACSDSGGNEVSPRIDGSVVDPSGGLDATTPDAADAVAPDAPLDAVSDAREEEAAPPVLKRFSGHVDYMGDVAGAKVTVLAPAAYAGTTTTTDASGDFFFYLPLGSNAVVKVETTIPNVFPMIRGVTIGDTNRIRVFYLAGPPERDAAQALGLTIDASKGIVEVDFRNANVGGYSVTLKNGAATVTPGFGVALDGAGDPVQSTSTVTGGDGSTLLLGNVAPGALSFTPSVPVAAPLPCTPCDAPTLPVEANVVTWFDFECGSATDCK